MKQAKRTAVVAAAVIILGLVSVSDCDVEVDMAAPAAHTTTQPVQGVTR